MNNTSHIINSGWEYVVVLDVCTKLSSRITILSLVKIKPATDTAKRPKANNSIFLLSFIASVLWTCI